MSHTYEQLVPRAEREKLEQALNMGEGYVLDFSDRTFNDFFYDTLGIDPETEGRLFNGRGTSKAKRLRSFIERAPASSVAKLLRGLWDYRGSIVTRARTPAEQGMEASYFITVGRFEGVSQDIDTSAIESFEPNETLDELVASIRRDLDAKKPHAALDRLHTYCMKRFASLVRKHGGGDCGNDDPLHSRVGRYVRFLGAQRNLTQMSERIIKSSISVFEAMNEIRNDKSLAHDNPDLIDPDEARFIFDSVTAILRYIKSVDGRQFED
ncbi:abortive infection family protein [Rhizobium ruizarguesonis]|uniref:abortive infection family protein n=1 Tax=Rhizobium brockwellii TaxID=3019932 RepID=UPI003F9A6EE2